MFTVDWFGHEDAEEAGDGGHKCAHVIALDNGNFAAQPNNRIQWFCPAFVTPFQEKPDYKTNTAVWKVERETETTAGFFYEDAKNSPQPSQVKLYAKGLRVDFARPPEAHDGRKAQARTDALDNRATGDRGRRDKPK